MFSMLFSMFSVLSSMLFNVVQCSLRFLSALSPLSLRSLSRAHVAGIEARHGAHPRTHGSIGTGHGTNGQQHQQQRHQRHQRHQRPRGRAVFARVLQTAVGPGGDRCGLGAFFAGRNCAAVDGTKLRICLENNSRIVHHIVVPPLFFGVRAMEMLIVFLLVKTLHCCFSTRRI